MIKCTKCKKYKDKNNFPPEKKKKNGLSSWCWDCKREKGRNYSRLLRLQNPKKYYEQQIKWRKGNPERIEKTKAVERRTKLKLRMQVLDAYKIGGKIECACCGEKEVLFLSIDHINNDGAKQRKELGLGGSFYYWLKRNNYPRGYQILCFNCNRGKYANHGECPHKTK